MQQIQKKTERNKQGWTVALYKDHQAQDCWAQTKPCCLGLGETCGPQQPATSDSQGSRSLGMYEGEQLLHAH